MEADRIGPDDPRYLSVVDKRFNKRFRARPDYVRLVGSTEQVMSAVEEAVREGRRLVVTSGGHCLEGFVSDPEVRVILDVSPMKRVYYDAAMGAVAVEGGATVGGDVPGAVRDVGRRDPARRISRDRHGRPCRRRGFWLPLPPARPSPRTISMASRWSSSTRATRESRRGTRETSARTRPLGKRDTGPAAATSESSPVLVPIAGSIQRTRSAGAAAPRAGVDRDVQGEWNWNDIDEPAFLRPGNHGTWCERNSGSDSPNASLWTLLEILRKQFGKIIVRGVGALINHPDIDLADPALNTSGVPWSSLYYQENYPRLQRIKARYDPDNLFRHALSIRSG
jgi:aclacinomycin oxidase